MIHGAQSNTCVVCGRPTLEDRWERQAWDEEPCKPGNCSVWKLVGKSRGGSPILRLVEDR